MAAQSGQGGDAQKGVARWTASDQSDSARNLAEHESAGERCDKQQRADVVAYRVGVGKKVRESAPAARCHDRTAMERENRILCGRAFLRISE